MKAQSVRLVGPTQREHAKRLVDSAPDGYVVKIAAETRRDSQNRLLHAVVQDLIDQTERFRDYTKEDVKLTFMAALRQEMRMLPELEGQGFFPVGAKTSELTVAQFAGLCELLYEWGERNGVRWSQPLPTPPA